MFARPLGIAALTLAISGNAFAQEPGAKPPVIVKIDDEKPVIVEAVMPIDPTPHVQTNNVGNMLVMVRVDNQNLHLGYLQTTFHIDGQIMYPGNPPGQMTVQNAPLPQTKDGKPRNGTMSVYQVGKVKITQEREVVATKGKPGEKRRLDAMMVRYLVENDDAEPHKVGVRVYMQPFILNNRGALFAAPNHPDKILDGMELKGDKVPDYLRVLQRPDLKDPGYVAHMTYNFGGGFDRPTRVVLTRINAIQQWDVAVMQSGGLSAQATFWDPKEVKAKTSRKMAYAFGQGIAPSPDGDGLVGVQLGGSFEPGKLFTIAAHVQDPAHGQTLTLELPAGMERMEGQPRQPVPAVDEDGNTMVLWKARVLETGRFTVRVHSSTGTTQTKIVTISRP